MYTGIFCRVKVNGSLSEEFRYKIGVCQGCLRSAVRLVDYPPKTDVSANKADIFTLPPFFLHLLTSQINIVDSIFKTYN